MKFSVTISSDVVYIANCLISKDFQEGPGVAIVDGPTTPQRLAVWCFFSSPMYVYINRIAVRLHAWDSFFSIVHLLASLLDVTQENLH